MTAESPNNPVNRPPTAKQARFVEGLTEGKSARRAALDAGYSESSADHATTEILPAVERAFGEVIRKMIPVERLVQRLDEGLDAVEVKVAAFEGTESPVEPIDREALIRKICGTRIGE